MLPSVRRIAALVFAPDPFSEPFLEQIRRAAANTGTTIEPIMMRAADEFEAVFRNCRRTGRTPSLSKRP